MRATATAVSRSATHTLNKTKRDSIQLLAGLGVDGDAHLGETVKHRSRVARDPSQPNLLSGEVRAGDPIRVELPPQPHRALEPV